MKFVTFLESVFVEGVLDFAGRARSGDKNSDDTNDDESKKSPRLNPDC